MPVRVAYCTARVGRGVLVGSVVPSRAECGGRCNDVVDAAEAWNVVTAAEGDMMDETDGAVNGGNAEK